MSVKFLLSSEAVSKAYLLLTLLIAMLMSPPPYSIAALVLLTAQIYSVYKHLRAELRLALLASTLIVVPLTLEPSAGEFLSAFLIVPALPLLNQSLKESASTQFFECLSDGRKFTVVTKAFAATLLLVLVLSLVLLNQPLMLTCGILIAYLTTVLAYVFRKIPNIPLEGSKVLGRVVVGDTATVPLTIRARAKIPLHVLLRAPHSWVQLNPSRFTLAAGRKLEVSLAATPPLAGPLKLRIKALALDPFGLTQISQTLELVELHIIPRAKYAEWLARKYLEQTAPGTAIAALPPPRATRAAKWGVEYYGSRLYHPGDRLKNIDWKHTFKLRELVVKEFIGAHGQPAVIAVNLTAEDPEEADILAYNLLTSALTLARESMPTALIAYNHKEVLTMIPLMNPREVLKRALKLTREIILVKPPQRMLQPPDVRKLRRSISQLEFVETKPAKKLMEILKLEYEVLRKAVKNHPANQALTKIVESISPPAVILVITLWTYDADTLNMTLENLKEMGYNTIPVSSPLLRNRPFQLSKR